MSTEPTADQVRLRVPAVASMIRVVAVSVRVLAGRAGLTESAAEQARAEVGDAFASLVDAGGDHIELVAAIGPGHLAVDLTSAGGSRRVTVTR